MRNPEAIVTLKKRKSNKTFHFLIKYGMLIGIVKKEATEFIYKYERYEMKRKTVAILFVCTAVAMAAGCGSNPGNGSGTEAVLEEGTETGNPNASINIAYNVDDYVTLGDYENVEVTLNEADYQVDDASVSSYIEQMIAYYSPYQADESKTVVEKGDIVNVDYVGKKDGEAFDGGTAQNQLIDTGTNSTPANPLNSSMGGGGFIEGFSDGLIGANVGDTIDWDVTFPEDYQSEELKGQAATFTFTINSIQKPVNAAEIDDAFVKENFGAETVEAFHTDVRSYLEQEAETARESDIRSAVIEVLTERCSVSGFPEGLLEARMDEYVEGFRKQYCSDGTDLDEFLQNNYNMTREEFENQSEEYLSTNLTQELIFEAIAKKEDIEFDQEGFNEYVSTVMSNNGFATAEEVYESYGSDQASGEKYMQRVYLDNKALTMVVDGAKVTYTKAEEPQDTEALADTEQ